MAKVKCEPAFTQFDKVNVRDARKLTVDGAEVETINPDHFTTPVQASYDSPNSFSMTGNQTEDFQIGRRVQLDSGQSDLTCNKPIFDLTPDDVFTANKYDYSIISGVAFDGVTTDVTIVDSIVTSKLQEASVDINWSGSQAGLITTTDLINSSQGYPSDYVLETSGFATPGDGGGGQWVQNGIVSQTPSQSPKNLDAALLNDGGGNQWRMIYSNQIEFDLVSDVVTSNNGNVEQRVICRELDNAEYITRNSSYSQKTGDLVLASGLVAELLSTNGVFKLGNFANLEDAINREVTIDMTGFGTYSLNSTITITVPIDLRCNDNSKITGYDGTGIIFSGSSIKLDGVNVGGFYDGTDQNKTNYSTTFIAVASGTTIDSIEVSRGNYTDNRSIIRVFNTTSDTARDASVEVNNVRVTKNSFVRCPMAFHLRCLFSNIEFGYNYFKESIGAMRTLAPIQFYLDGEGKASPLNSQTQGFVVSNNIFNTIINRTTTGDSSSGNSYESHAIMASGEKIVISNNTITDCTGVEFDCEAIYTKARYVNISDNVIIDGGSKEAAINVKGMTLEGDITNNSPLGDYSIISNNIIRFTRDTYDNDGTIVNLETIGIHCAVPEKVIISGNIIDGANDTSIVMDGVIGSTFNNGTIIEGNIGINSAGSSFIRYRGAFIDHACNNNVCIDVKTDNSTFYAFDFISVIGRGTTNRGITISDNLLELGYQTQNEAGHVHSFARFDTENYSFDGIYINNNIIDIQQTAASARPIYFNSQTASPVGEVDDLTIKNNKFKNKHYATGPLFFSVIPKTFELDLTYDWESTQNAAQNALLVPIADDRVIDAEFRIISTRIDSTGFGQRDVSNFIGNTSAGSLNVIDNTAETPIGNAVGIGCTFNTTNNDLRVTISGEDSQTWNHNISLSAVSR